MKKAKAVQRRADPSLQMTLTEFDMMISICQRLSAAQFFVSHIDADGRFAVDQVEWLLEAARAQSVPALLDLHKVIRVLGSRLQRRRSQR